jgi:hypothetical protein
MKITKSYLKQVIKEELNKLQELTSTYSPGQIASRRKRSQTVYGVGDSTEQDTFADLEDELETMNPNDIGLRASLIPAEKLTILKRNPSMKARLEKAGY